MLIDPRLHPVALRCPGTPPGCPLAVCPVPVQPQPWALLSLPSLPVGSVVSVAGRSHLTDLLQHLSAGPGWTCPASVGRASAHLQVTSVSFSVSPLACACLLPARPQVCSVPVSLGDCDKDHPGHLSGLWVSVQICGLHGGQEHPSWVRLRGVSPGL